MSLGFYNLALLSGLAALAVPVLIHLLTRRRHEVVEWGAMQFLRHPAAKRTRRTFDEWWLLLVRMALLALIAAGLAAPYVAGPLVAAWLRVPRDVVLVLDVSASMDLRLPGKSSPWEEARTKAFAMLEELGARDRAIVLLATRPPIRLNPGWTHDFAELKRLIEVLPMPRGSADGPEAFAQAWKFFADEPRAADREIWIAADFKEWGWMDEQAQARWHTLAHQLATKEREPVKLTTHWIKPAFSKSPPSNFGLAPLQQTRAFAGVGQKITLATQLHRRGHDAGLPFPRSARILVDGKETGRISLAPKKESSQSLSFDVRLEEPGLHHIQLALEPPAAGSDCLPSDNQQDLIVEAVAELPVVLVEGSAMVSPRSSAYFLDRAFADPSDPKKVSLVVPRVTSSEDFEIDAGAPPRVVVLADVPHLREEQWRALEEFVRAGGGLWVILGPRVAEGREAYNENGFRDGKGLLPAALSRVSKTEGVRLDAGRWLHAPLEIFKSSSLGQAPVTTWWTVEPASDASAWALLTNGQPWLLHKVFGKGRVLLSTVPMDRSWDSALAPAWEFPVLAHELVYALADARSNAFNFDEGNPLVLSGDHLPGWSADLPLPVAVSWTPFAGPREQHVVGEWPAVLPPLGPAGVYDVRIGAGLALPFATRLDSRESDLSYASEEQWRAITDLLPVLSDAAPQSEHTPSHSFDTWWLVLTAAMMLLLLESWLTGHLARTRGLS
jgi:hypothetical protein